MNLVTQLQMAAQTVGERVAFGPRDGGMSYAELFDRAANGATHLREVGAERLVYLGVNDPAFPVAVFAAAWAGLPIVPLNYRLSDTQLTELIEEQEQPTVIVESGAENRVPATGGDVLDGASWLERTRSGPGAEAAAPWDNDPDALAVLLYTSGTTAKPKAAILRHSHLTSYVLGGVEFMSAGEDDASLVSVPPYHIAGVANVLSNVYACRRVVQLPHFDPQSWLDTARAEQVTHALVVPTMLARTVQALDGAADAEVPSLRTLAYGGARMPLPVIERALELFPGVEFANAYGLTETSSTLSVLGPDEHREALASNDPAVRARLASVGRTLPGIEIEVRDADSCVCAPGEVGEIFVRGPQVSGEYVAEGSRLDDDGWFPTRDRGRLDEEGYVFIEGRADDVIIRGGENIAPAEIEDVLLQLPDVLEAAVVGVPDEEWGQQIAAVVVARSASGLEVDDVRDHARRRLRSSRTPERIELWDALPRTDTGKLVRREVLTGLGAPA